MGGPVKTFFLLHTLVAQVTTGPARLSLRPIRFAGGVGGHAAALDVAKEAQRRGVRRLVFARIWQAAVRALDAGDRPPFGEIGRDGEVSVQEAVSAAARWVAGRVEPELRRRLRTAYGPEWLEKVNQRRRAEGRAPPMEARRRCRSTPRWLRTDADAW